MKEKHKRELLFPLITLSPSLSLRPTNFTCPFPLLMKPLVKSIVKRKAEKVPLVINADERERREKRKFPWRPKEKEHKFFTTKWKVEIHMPSNIPSTSSHTHDSYINPDFSSGMRKYLSCTRIYKCQQTSARANRN